MRGNLTSRACTHLRPADSNCSGPSDAGKRSTSGVPHSPPVQSRQTATAERVTNKCGTLV